MNTSERVLVIILSSTLAILLILSIILIVKLIQLTNNLKEIAKKAERVADKVEAVSDFFRNAAAPAAVTRLLAGIADTVLHRKHKSKPKGDNDG